MSSIADQSTRRGESTFVGAEVGLRYHLTPRMVWQMGSTRSKAQEPQGPDPSRRGIARDLFAARGGPRGRPSGHRPGTRCATTPS